MIKDILKFSEVIIKILTYTLSNNNIKLLSKLNKNIVMQSIINDKDIFTINES